MKNYYKILGTDQTATPHEIKQAHKALLAEYSSGDAHEKGYTAERYIDIAIAYETLVNAEKRMEYDRILNSVLPPQQEPLKQAKEPVESQDMLLIPKTKNNFVRYGLYIGVLLIVLTAVTLIQVGNIGKPDAAPVAHSEPSSNNSIQQSLKAIQKQDKSLAVKEVKNNQSIVAAPAVPAVVPNEPVVKNRIVKKEQKPEPKQLATIVPVKAKTRVPDADADVPSDATTSLVVHNPQIGTTKKEVLKALGTPSAIVRYDNDNEIWKYSNRNIYFSSNKIISFNDVANNHPGDTRYE